MTVNVLLCFTSKTITNKQENKVTFPIVEDSRCTNGSLENFTILVDRLKGYIACEKTQNKGTESAILAVKNWANTFGYPYKVISDTGPAFRTNFIKQLLTTTALQRGPSNQ